MRKLISAAILSTLISLESSFSQSPSMAGEVAITSEDKADIASSGEISAVPVPVIEQETIYTTVIKDAEKPSDIVHPINLANLVLYYPEETIKPVDRKKVSLIEDYATRLQIELQQERYYYLTHEYIPGDMPYAESFWAALGKTAVGRSKTLQKVDRAARQVSENLSIKYETAGFKWRLQPYLSGVENIEELGVHITARDPHVEVYYKNYAETEKIGLELKRPNKVNFSTEYKSESEERTVSIAVSKDL